MNRIYKWDQNKTLRPQYMKQNADFSRGSFTNLEYCHTSAADPKIFNN